VQYTNEEVEDADTEHIERDADMTVVVEPVMHLYTQASHTHAQTHTYQLNKHILLVSNVRMYVCLSWLNSTVL